MSNCIQHKKEVAGISDMKALAKMIGDLHYETLSDLLYHLSIKLYRDGLKDRRKGREKLGYALNDASDKIQDAGNEISKAWQISKPYMQ